MWVPPCGRGLLLVKSMIHARSPSSPQDNNKGPGFGVDVIIGRSCFGFFLRIDGVFVLRGVECCWGF